MEHTPKDSGFGSRVRASFAAQGMMHLLGARITGLEPGLCHIEVPVTPETGQQHGFAHAGLGWTIGDSAAGYAALSLMAATEEVVTVEMKTNLMAPAKGEVLLAEGRVLRPGRRLYTVAADIFSLDGGTRTHIAAMLGTMTVVRAGPG